jgi:hypothetical protein
MEGKELDRLKLRMKQKEGQLFYIHKVRDVEISEGLTG